MAVPKLIRFSTPWQSMLLVLLNYAMLVLLAITLAYWSWQLFQPDPISAPSATSTPNQNLAGTINAAQWFGESSHGSTTSLELKLVGIFGALSNASSKHPGFAIFQMSDGKQLHAMLNQEFSSGLKLTDIGRDSVTILQNGVPQHITLDEKSRPLEITRIKSSARNTDARSSDMQAVPDEKKVRQVRIVGTKPRPVTATMSESAKQKSVAADKQKQVEQSAPPLRTPDVTTARQNTDDMKYLPVEKPEPKPEDQHENLATTEAKNESQPAPPEEVHAEKKGLVELLNSVKNWVTGKKQEQQ